jgi:hypothetical protein
MSTSRTRNGLLVTCDAPSCLCNVKPATDVKPATVGGIDADAEEQWFSDLCDSVDEYLNLYRLHRETPKADQPSIAAQMHEAKSDVIARFYAQPTRDMTRPEWRIA